MRRFSRLCLLFLVLGVALCACSSGGGDNGNENDGGDPPVVRYWGAAETLETSSEDAEYPQIAMNADGSAIAVWAQYDSTRYSIWANRFDGSAWGGDMRDVH